MWASDSLDEMEGSEMRAVSKSRYWIWLVVGVVAVLGLAAVGCNELSPVDTGSSATDTGATTTEAGVTTTGALESTTTEAPVVPTTTVKVGASETLTASGTIKACGLIKEVWVDGGVRKIKIDYVDFLTGAAADAAAVAAGEIAPGEHVDNDYYVSNVNPKLRTFVVSNSVHITTYSRVMPIDAADPPVSWDDFSDFWNLIGPQLPEDMGLFEGLWWIERSSTTNAVVSIEQQWVP
jgi:hypothetical protein